MSDTKPLPDDPDRTAATPAAPAPTAAGPAPTAAGPAPTTAGPPLSSSGPAHVDAEPVDLTPGEPVWAAQPAPGPAATTHAPAATGSGGFRAAGSGLRRSRVGIPVLVGVVALVLGRCLGAGLVAAGAFVFGDGHRGDDRGRISRDERAPHGGPAWRGDERGDGRDGRKPAHPGQDGMHRRPTPGATPPGPAASSPATPAAPSSPATS
ncbi:hypothetical protein Daura_38440 [Dactylosporangium aurantiacum]|uniref:Uncharacterized protein n=1 Tax=Dactylosporangium aurantiacum TaxID=35754 RepID=A0A9Q9IH53_9ACTN|nr:hypothetical protein [Dactylosporangium aurantiacum]MDG6101699.1 hypothetical protein [Dactylosporangium aurantiacum]UWZ52485.1 hypothetical protein Daura_38440 [Dactylosporangium aurantiacum]